LSELVQVKFKYFPLDGASIRKVYKAAYWMILRWRKHKDQSKWQRENYRPEHSD